VGEADRRASPQERRQRWRHDWRTAVYESVPCEQGDRRASPRRTTVPTYRRSGEGGFGGANGVEGDGGSGFGEYYWLVGQRAVEFGIWGGGGSRGGRGEFGAWSVSPSAVPCVSEEASRSMFRLCEPFAGPTV
jgi:hypothetical protein